MPIKKKNTKMKIVFLTNKSPHGFEILKNLKKRKIPIEAIIIEEPKLPQKIKKSIKIIKKYGLTKMINIIVKNYFSVSSKNTKKIIDKNFYNKYSSKVIVTDNLNGCLSAMALLKLQPELIILGGTGIIKDYILSIPKIGTLNAHPGLLPKYKGVDVIPWAIYNHDEVGVTVHFVDKGVDTGKIICQAKVAISSKDNLETITQKAMILGCSKMAEVVEKFYKGQKIVVKKQKSKGILYHKMPDKLIEIVKKGLSHG